MKATATRIRLVRAMRWAFCAVGGAGPLSLVAAAASLPWSFPFFFTVSLLIAALLFGFLLPVSLERAAGVMDAELKSKERFISALELRQRNDSAAQIVKEQAEELAQPVTPFLRLPRWALFVIWLHLIAALIYVTAVPEKRMDFGGRLMVVVGGGPKGLKRLLRDEIRRSKRGIRERLVKVVGSVMAEVNKVRTLLSDPKVASILAKIGSGLSSGGEGGEGEGAGVADALRKAASSIQVNNTLAELLRRLADAVSHKERNRVRRLLEEIDRYLTAAHSTAQQIGDLITGLATPIPDNGSTQNIPHTLPTPSPQLAPQTRLALIRAQRYPPFLRAAIIQYFQREEER